MNIKHLFGVVCLVAVFSCNLERQGDTDAANPNPPSPGFDLAHSDPAAVELADSIMAAIGGRRNWDKVRFISWRVNDLRKLLWDKQNNRVRIESYPDNTVYLLDLDKNTGRIRMGGRELTNRDSLEKMLQRAKDLWHKDSYGLLMPYKLKGDGATIRYLGEDTLANGTKCNIIELTFANENYAPENKYRVFVDRKDNLVKQWAYYEKADQDFPTAVYVCDDYRKYGNILLSTAHSDGNGPNEVKVDDKIPDHVFTDF